MTPLRHVKLLSRKCCSCRGRPLSTVFHTHELTDTHNWLELLWLRGERLMLSLSLRQHGQLGYLSMSRSGASCGCSYEKMVVRSLTVPASHSPSFLAIPCLSSCHHSILGSQPVCSWLSLPEPVWWSRTYILHLDPPSVMLPGVTNKHTHLPIDTSPRLIYSPILSQTRIHSDKSKYSHTHSKTQTNAHTAYMTVYWDCCVAKIKMTTVTHDFLCSCST